MSFTPSLFAVDGKQLPLANEDELFILERAKISFKVETGIAKYKGKGRVYCTTQRIIFVADKPVMQHGIMFEAFEVPLQDMTDEKFSQPIFGACAICGLVKPSDDSSEDDTYSWKIIFDNGGTGIVLPVFLRLLEKRKKQEIIDMNFVQSQHRAFVDPNDPTVIYLAQPVSTRTGAPAVATTAV